MQQEKEAIKNLDRELEQAREENEDEEMGWSNQDGSYSGWEEESNGSQDQIASEASRHDSNANKDKDEFENIRVYQMDDV